MGAGYRLRDTPCGSRYLIETCRPPVSAKYALAPFGDNIMPTVICKYPVTYNGKRYKPGDAFYAEDKYITEVSKCCEPVEQPEEPQHKTAKKTKASK